MKSITLQLARITLVLIIAVSAVLLPACKSSKNTSPYTVTEPAARDTAKAQRLNQQAADLMADDPGKAEQLLREALAADLFFGPAHNNLGVLFLNRSELYLAASEFEWARKLMPGHPDPRLNLGIVLERSGRIDEALGAYHAALEVRPGHIPSLQALTRCEIRNGETSDNTSAALKQIALEGTSHQWREWAHSQLARRD